MMVDIPARTRQRGATPCAPSVERAEIGGPVVLLCTGSVLGRIVQNAFAAHVADLVIIEEQQERRGDILRRRARLVGWGGALSQLAAGLIARTRLRRNRQRIQQLCDHYGFNPAPLHLPVPNADRAKPTARAGQADVDTGPRLRRYTVSSVNTANVRAILMRHAPAVVAVYGTRLLSQATLSCVTAPFVNYHAGLTPDYRGQHPGYWALADGRPERAGVTVHYVDSGVDTGQVIAQAVVPLDPKSDSLSTYQFVQMATGLPLLLDAVVRLRRTRQRRASGQGPHRAPEPRAETERSRLPPTLRQYLTTGIRRGIW